jgi:hypothetical protein
LSAKNKALDLEIAAREQIDEAAAVAGGPGQV